MRILIVGTLLFPILAVAQSQPKPCARFSFNNNDSSDEITKHKAEFHTVRFVADRFGNENHAAFLTGNPTSYIALGNFKELKSTEGSISLWVKIEHPVMAGNGTPYNPILVAHCNSSQDFNEAYAIYFMVYTKKILATCSMDSLNERGMYSKDPIELDQWKHIVMVYTNDTTELYIDGKFETSFSKKFKTAFLNDEPVFVGKTNNPKNDRWLTGAVDDIEFFPYPLGQSEITALYNAPNPSQTIILRNRILTGVAIALILLAVYLFIRYRVKRSFEKQRKQLEQDNLIVSTELRVNRALMNPHFVFNALNALQNLILNNKNDKANDYLVKFSKMIRKLLESNMSDLISIDLETELLNRYLEIENLRFEENIIFKISVDPSIQGSNVYVPVMMVQPFVENAIWHGLLKKKGEKLLDIYFEKIENKYILCTIDDNGLGRKRKKSSVIFDKSSLATSFIEQRLRLFNQSMGLKCYLNLEFKPEGKGTTFKILLPILTQQNTQQA